MSTPATPAAPTKTVDPKAVAFDHAIAYHILFLQEKAVKPSLTVKQYQQWLREQFAANVKFAKSQHDAQKGAK